MKDSAWYNKLWQQKMQEFPVEGDGDAAWEKMQGLLDKHMPVSSPAGSIKPRKSWGSTLITVAGAIIIAALVYLAATHYFAGHNHIPQRQHPMPKSDSAQNTRLNTNRNEQLNNSKAGTPANQNNIAGDSITAINAGDTKSAGNTRVIVKNGAVLSTGSSVLAKQRSKVKRYSISNGGIDAKITVKNRNRVSAVGYNSAAGITANVGNAKTGGHHLRTAYTYNNKLKKQGIISAGVNTVNISVAGNKYKNAADSIRASLAANLNIKPSGTVQTNNQASVHKKADSAALALKSINTGKKSSSDSSTAKNKTAKTAIKKARPDKKTSSNSKFELGVKFGANVTSSASIFAGIAATYYISPKFGVGVGINSSSPKVISGSYSKTNLSYTTIPDTGKAISHNTGKVSISGSRKVYSVEIPIFATYKVNRFISFSAGPVISIPVKQQTMKRSLSLLSNAADTTALKHVAPYVNGTTINNKANLSFSAGIKLNYNRVYLDAEYLQNVTPYTISSGLGSGKIYYHTVQIGIGFYLFKPKSK